MEPVVELLWRLPQTSLRTEPERDNHDVEGVDEVVVQKLADRSGPAAKADVLALGCVPCAPARPPGRPKKSGLGVAEGERAPGVVGQHEDRRAERRLVAPPALPLIVLPRASLRPELVAAPMISAPMLRVKSGVKWSSRPRLRPGSVRFGQLAVAPAQAKYSPGSA